MPVPLSPSPKPAVQGFSRRNVIQSMLRCYNLEHLYFRRRKCWCLQHCVPIYNRKKRREANDICSCGGLNISIYVLVSLYRCKMPHTHIHLRDSNTVVSFTLPVARLMIVDTDIRDEGGEVRAFIKMLW